MQTNQRKKTNQIVDFVFAIDETALFDSVAFPPKNRRFYFIEEIAKVENVKSAFENLGIVSDGDGCKVYYYTEQDLIEMGD